MMRGFLKDIDYCGIKKINANYFQKYNGYENIKNLKMISSPSPLIALEGAFMFNS